MEFSWAPYGSSTAEPAATAAPADATPARRLAVVTCMDARVDPLRALGLKLGDAHVIRNAGAVVTDDVLQSLVVSRDAAGTTSIVLMGHTDCKAHGGDDEVARAVLRSGLERVRSALPGLEVSAALYDVATGRVSGL